MINYQKFVMYYTELRREIEQRGLKDIQFHQKERLFYDKIGITDEDKIKQLEYRKTTEMNNRIENGIGMIMQYGSIFQLDEKVRRYVILNKPPKEREVIDKLVLPFKSIFIETEITSEDYDIGVDKINGLLIQETSVIEESSLKQIARAFIVYYFCEDRDSDGSIKYWIDEFKICYDPSIPMYYDDKKTLRFLREFIANILLFFNDPEIEVVRVERSQKNAERRKKEGKLPLPEHRIVRLTGKLKEYIDGSFGTGLSGQHYNYRFYVRGHTRLLKSEYYKQKKGKIIKIEPYMKGQGVLLKRTYELDFEKKDDRLKALKAENVFYDDIKPLKKPLREMRDGR